jgi:hypothetical protein
MKKLKDVGNGYWLDTDAIIYSTKISQKWNLKGELREVQPKRMKTGYHYAPMYNDADNPKKKMFYRLHRLVWETFVGPIPKGLLVHHKDHNKANNSLKNLSLVTYSQNRLLYLEWKKKQKSII